MKSINENERINYLMGLILSSIICENNPKAKVDSVVFTEDGFYMDADLGDKTMSLNELPTLENQIKKMLNNGIKYKKEKVSLKEAKKLFIDNKYKLEKLLEFKNEVPIIKINDYVDICDYEFEDLKECKVTKKDLFYSLSNSSTAYYKNDSNNIQLNRINGIAFNSKEKLKEYIDYIEEAKKRDHRKIGKELGLFMFDDTAPGMPYWLPNGWLLFNNLVDYWRNVHKKNGYMEFSGPQLNNSELWKISGHWDHYKDDMFVFRDADGQEQALKPMSCPNAIKVYSSKTRSYKDLPLRFNDLDVIHRNEASGTLHGLLRVRMFRQDDSHNFISESQIKDECSNIFEMSKELYDAFGLKFRPALSTRPNDFMGDISLWNKAENELAEVLTENFGENGFDVNEGDGAFYGPKIDLYMKDCLNREWQMGTIQLDFQLPRNFNLSYINNVGERDIPVIIHRTIYGSLERFIGILTEHFNGAFPMWISPTQVNIIPVNDGIELKQYIKDINEELEDSAIRTIIDDSNEKLGYKIRKSQVEKIPMTFVIGNNEFEQSLISYRNYGQKNTITDEKSHVINKVRKLAKPPYNK